MTRCRLCERNASYSIKGDKGGKFCSIHKTDEMINVVSKRCEYSNCESLNNNFDFKNGNGRFCKLHKMAEMIDVVSKRCEYNDCVIRATFDIKDGKGKFCKKHKTLEMVDVKLIEIVERSMMDALGKRNLTVPAPELFTESLPKGTRFVTRLVLTCN
jgi:hypothetical protein